MEMGHLLLLVLSLFGVLPEGRRGPDRPLRVAHTVARLHAKELYWEFSGRVFHVKNFPFAGNYLENRETLDLNS